MSKHEECGNPKRAVAAVLLVLATSAVACSGGAAGDALLSPAGLEASFAGSGAVGVANRVRTSGSAAGDLVTVAVMIGGPTTSTDLYSFAFDLELGDTTVAEYVAGSASMGTALKTDVGQTMKVLAVQVGDRVTVGVTKLGGGSGNGVSGPGEEAIVELAFRLLRSGTTTLTLKGSPGSDPAALDASGGIIGSVTFDSTSVTLMGL